MIKLQDMPPQQRIVTTLVFLVVLAISVIGFFAPRGSTLAWQMQRFLFFIPGLLIGYALGVWVGSSKKVR